MIALYILIAMLGSHRIEVLVGSGYTRQPGPGDDLTTWIGRDKYSVHWKGCVAHCKSTDGRSSVLFRCGAVA